MIRHEFSGMKNSGLGLKRNSFPHTADTAGERCGGVGACS